MGIHKFQALGHLHVGGGDHKEQSIGVGTSRTLGVQGAGVLSVILPHMNEENIETEPFCQGLSQLPVSINR